MGTSDTDASTEKTLTLYRSIDDVNENQWNSLVEQANFGSVFHRTGWLAAVEKGLGLRPRHLVLEKSGNPVAMLPNFIREIDVPDELDWVNTTRAVSSKPGFGGPVIVGDETENFDLLFGRAADALSADNVVYHQIRTPDDGYLRYSNSFLANGYTAETSLCRFTIDLSRGWDDVLSNVSNSKQSRMTEDAPVSISDAPITDANLRAFYEKYETAMQRIDGLLYPYSFFEQLREQFSDRLKLFLVEVEGELAGGSLNLEDDERSSLHNFFKGLDEQFFAYNVSEKIDEYAMKWAIEHGYDEYDLGATPADFTDGVFNYKRELGAEPETLIAWEKGCSTLRWPLYRYGRKLLATNRDGESLA